MKSLKYIAAIGIWCFGAAAASAQVFSIDMLNNVRNIKVGVTVKDKTNGESMPWTSCYLIPVGDTTITHFTITANDGTATFGEVPVGKYTVNVEMMGYLPYRKDHDFSREYGEVDIEVALEADAEYLEAATVSAVGNAITIKKDTIEYNAASFHIGQNDMLIDLIKKMPGFEVGKDGTVKNNGETVDKITVGGRTFFFGNNSAALNNLPAQIVDKIKVIDKKTDIAEFTGVGTSLDREKVMDVELKDDYKTGRFGSLKMAGGATVNPDADKQPLVKDNSPVFNGNGMFTTYSEKDQLVLIGSAQNYQDLSEGVVVVIAEDDMDSAIDMMSGITTSATAGANINTTRLKGFESTAQVTYNLKHVDNAEQSHSQSFQPGEADLLSDNSFTSASDNNSVGLNLEARKTNTSKWTLNTNHTIKFSKSSSNRVESNSTYNDFTSLQSESVTNSSSKGISASGNLNAGLRSKKKSGRNITTNFNYSAGANDGESSEISSTVSTQTSTRNLLYDNQSRSYSLGGTLGYTEPLTSKFKFQEAFRGSWSGRESDKDAMNGQTLQHDDYFSSWSRSDALSFSSRSTLQYTQGANNLVFGAELTERNTVIRSRSMGMDKTTGEDEWNLIISPFLNYSFYNSEGMNIMIYTSGGNSAPSASNLSTVLDVSNPVQFSTGNVYLRPSHYQTTSINFTKNDRKTFGYYSAYAYVRNGMNQTVQASWFDQEGKRYSIPVNTRKPSMSVDGVFTIRQPVGKSRKFTVSVSGATSIESNTSYQATKRLEGMNISAFDYQAFMNDFWGTDAKGDRFYNGASGFAESVTKEYTLRGIAGLRYSSGGLDIRVSAEQDWNKSLYSLDASANRRTSTTTYELEASYTSKEGWEFSTDLSRYEYRGYSAGYDKPYNLLNVSASKDFGKFNVYLKGNDLLGQTRSLSRTVSQDFIKDTYQLALRRMVVIGISFRFGKADAAKNNVAQSALLNTLR